MKVVVLILFNFFHVLCYLFCLFIPVYTFMSPNSFYEFLIFVFCLSVLSIAYSVYFIWTFSRFLSFKLFSDILEDVKFMIKEFSKS